MNFIANMTTLSDAHQQKLDMLKALNAINLELYEQYKKYLFYDEAISKPHLHKPVVCIGTGGKIVFRTQLKCYHLSHLDFSFMPFSDALGREYISIAQHLEIYAGLVPIVLEEKLKETEVILTRANKILTNTMDAFRKYQRLIIRFYGECIEEYDAVVVSHDNCCCGVKIKMDPNDIDFSVKMVDTLVASTTKSVIVTKDRHMDKIFEFYMEADTVLEVSDG